MLRRGYFFFLFFSSFFFFFVYLQTNCEKQKNMSDGTNVCIKSIFTQVLCLTTIISTCSIFHFLLLCTSTPTIYSTTFT